MERTTYKELLAVKPFRDLWIGQAVSQLGDALYYLTFLFMVDKLTGDERLVGLNGMVQTLPFLLLGLYAGVVADRRDRRGILLRADVASFAALAAFALLLLLRPVPPVWTLFVAGFALSAINVFFAPAKNAAIPNLVPPHLLLPANALSAATQNLMPLVGLGVSGGVLGALYALAPRWFFFAAVALNGLSFLVSAVFVRRLPALPPDRDKGAKDDAWAEIRDGLRYVRGQRVLLVLLVLSVLVQLMIAPFMVVYITVNREWFGGDYRTLALFEFSFMVGMVLVSAWVGRLNVRRLGVAFIAGMAVVGATVAAMAGARSIFWMCFWNFAAGLALPFGQIPITTYLQAVVPDAFRGRVNALLAMATFGVQPLAIGAAGLFLREVGPEAMFLIMGGGMGVAALLGLIDRAFRTAVIPGADRPPAAPPATGSTAAPA
jgi:MFS family permease